MRLTLRRCVSGFFPGTLFSTESGKDSCVRLFATGRVPCRSWMECIGLVVDCVVGFGCVLRCAKRGYRGNPPDVFVPVGSAKPTQASGNTLFVQTQHNASSAANREPRWGGYRGGISVLYEGLRVSSPRPRISAEKSRTGLASTRRTSNAANYKKGACIAIVC